MEIKLGNKEKRLLTVFGVVFAVALIGPNVLSQYASQYERTKSQEASAAKTRLTEAQNELDGFEDQKKILRRYVDRYNSLVENDEISKPDVIDVVKKMKAIGIERKLQNATTFNFADEVVVEPEQSMYMKDSNVKIGIHPLNIEMGMLHDLDIFMFMESLGNQVSSRLFPVRCSMSLTELEFSIVERENMQASCEIHWYSVDDPDRNIKTEEETEETTTATAN